MKEFKTDIRLAREMSLMDATMIGVGAMIGAGIFVLIGIAAGVAGPALLLSFVLNGLVALLTAMAYAELGSCYHDAGGGYLWVKEALPKWNGFLSGWMSWFAHAVACSLYALGFGAYFEHVFHELSLTFPHWGFLSPQKILAIAAALLFGYINFRGASETGKIGNLVTMAKIIILLIFIGFGLELLLRRGDIMATFSPFMPNGPGGIFRAMGLTFIAFQGFEVIAQSSEEIQNPKRNIPRAVFLSLVIVIPIYLLVGFVALGTVNPQGMTPWDYLATQKEIALVDVARNFFIGGGVMILVGGVISTLSALNATIYSSSRVAFAMGRDRNFPAFFSKVHEKNQTPHWGILISLIIITFMAVSLPIEAVASAADIMFLLLFLQVNVAMIRLRKKRPDLDRGYKVPFFPVLSIIAIILLLFLAINMFNYSLIAWIVAGSWIVVGFLVYLTYASHREVKYLKKVKALDSITKKEYSLLVCVSNHRNADSLASIALGIAKQYQAKIIFLHVIEVLEGKKRIPAQQEITNAEELLSRAEKMANEEEIPAKSVIKVSHLVSQGIMDTAWEENCNFILIGRQKKTKFLEQFFSSMIDKLLQKATTEVAVLHGEIDPDKIRTILIPYSDNIHTQLAMEIVPALKEFYHAKVQIAVVINPDAGADERQKKVDQIRELIQENDLQASIRVILNEDVLNGILKASQYTDLLVMGGRSGDFIELLFARSLSREITEQVACPVLWLKEYEERKSFISSLFHPYRT